jgi:hypothetical protein
MTRPTLHLSGPRLRGALEALIAAAEPVGGIERLVAAVRLRGEVIADRLGRGRAGTIERGAFDEIAVLMPTVRRRVGGLIDLVGWMTVSEAIVELLDGAKEPGSGDNRVARLCARFRGQTHGSDPMPHRFHRDLAAEVLHAVHPEHYPLMTRWVWDAKANTGVLREIWHEPSGGDPDRMVLDVPDTLETFLVLREELSQFLSEQGIFRDMIWYVDALEAQIYAGYINAQGGALLRPDFASGVPDPLEQTRRVLGLDRVSRRGREIVSGEWPVVSGVLDRRG